jgi:hypothetical protein
MTTIHRALPLAAAALLLAACGDDPSSSPAPAAPSATAEPARLRVAHLSPDAPAVDVCLSPAGSGAWSGPVLEGAGAAAGLSFGEVTRYLEIDGGSYDVRVVAATARDCAAPAVPDTSGVRVEGGETYTVAATGLAGAGSGDTAFALVPFLDETEAAAGKVKVRFIHASPGTPPVDVGVGSGASFTPVFDAVPFGEADEDVGPRGYFETEPLAGATLSARASGTTEDALVLEGVTLPAGAVVTVFATGLLGGDPPLAALVCPDDPGAAGALLSCAVLP